MDFNNLGKFDMAALLRAREKAKEIKELYGASEAEMELVSQLMVVTRLVLNVSPELHVKLLKILTAVCEMVNDELKEKK